LKPVGRCFSYDVFSLMIDLDRLDEADVRQQCGDLPRLAVHADEMRRRILETDKHGPLLPATLSGVQPTWKTGKILRLVTRIPHLTLEIVAGIHWEVLKLWIKGVRCISRPQAPQATSVWRNGHKVSLGFSDESQVGGPAE
jgi:DUF1365 family protein